jgi:hypothetical protein
MEGFGPGSEFGLENLLKVFDLTNQGQETMPAQARHTIGFGCYYSPARKIRYLSSAYGPGSALSEPFIIGRLKTAVRRIGGRCRTSPSGPTI